MSRRLLTTLALVVVLGTTAAGSALADASRGSSADRHRSANSPELSVGSRLADRREVAAGTRAYAIGFQDGRFYANGWHITGEMGGVWTPPLKLADGVWFGLDNQWVGPATSFSSGWGHTRYRLPQTAGLRLERTDVAPDGRRGTLFGLTIGNPGAARTVRLTVDAHSELLGQYPWGFSGVTPNAKDNLADRGRYDGRRLVFTDDGTLPGAAEHHYAAVVGTALKPTSGQIGDQFWGPQPGRRCTGQEPGAPADPRPAQCDDGPFGRGTGGRLTYSLALPASGSTTVWLAVAGSDRGLAPAQQELSRLLANPDAQLAAKIRARERLARRSQLWLPDDPLIQNAVDWGKQNLADLTQSAENLQIRWTDQGTQYPPALGTVPKATWIGAGFPDYPWLFGTDAEYTGFAAVSVGQFEAIKDHLRALRDISTLLNPGPQPHSGSGVVVHEVVSDGAVYFGHDSRRPTDDGSTAYDFNTDETVKFPSAVALLWRWTGDNRFRDEMYPFAVRNLRYVARRLDAERDGWPEGLGNVERTGLGPEKLDNAVYFIRGLADLADLARSKRDRTTSTWAAHLAQRLLRRFDGTWWDAATQQYADSLTGPNNQQSAQKHWIGQTPMEAELPIGTVSPGAGPATAALAPAEHAAAALAGRETDCYSGRRPVNPGLFHTGCGGGANGKGELVTFGLTTSIQAAGEGNYGRLGPAQQQRYSHALAETMFAQPATGGTPDEQPGAMPEIFASPDQGANIDRCWTCRSMFMQAWGHYGTAWPVVHQWLGVRPDLGRARVEFVPQLPPGQHLVRGKGIRLGSGSVDVLATRAADRYLTRVDVPRAVAARTVVVGHTLSSGARPTLVELDGRRVRDYRIVQTSRGTEVRVPTTAGRHTLLITV
jgi:hypothetical protein